MKTTESSISPASILPPLPGLTGQSLLNRGYIFTQGYIRFIDEPDVAQISPRMNIMDISDLIQESISRTIRETSLLEAFPSTFGRATFITLPISVDRNGSRFLDR